MRCWIFKHSAINPSSESIKHAKNSLGQWFLATVKKSTERRKVFYEEKISSCLSSTYRSRRFFVEVAHFSNQWFAWLNKHYSIFCFTSSTCRYAPTLHKLKLTWTNSTNSSKKCHSTWTRVEWKEREHKSHRHWRQRLNLKSIIR